MSKQTTNFIMTPTIEPQDLFDAPLREAVRLAFLKDYSFTERINKVDEYLTKWI